MLDARRAWSTVRTVITVVVLAVSLAAVLVRSAHVGPDALPPAAAPVPAGPDGEVVLAAVGDIACPPGEKPRDDACQQAATADVVDAIKPALVLTLGDQQYSAGELEGFEYSHDATWGRFKTITRPIVGNHDAGTAGAAGYFAYFGAEAGDPATGYYSFDAGSWHIIALNTECRDCRHPGSGQQTWLRDELATNSGRCVLAYMHRPRFSSDDVHGNATEVTNLWRTLYDGGADVVLAGHAHTYERFAPQTPTGELDLDRGVRSFVVGTGGNDLYGLGDKQPNSEIFQDDTFGVLKMILRPDSYSWEFDPISGGAFGDSGSDRCHST